MAITTTLTTLATGAATLIASTTKAALTDETPVMVQNQDSAINIYIGGATVTASGATTGIKIQAGQSFPLTLLNSDSLYAIAASGTPNVVVMLGRQ